MLKFHMLKYLQMIRIRIQHSTKFHILWILLTEIRRKLDVNMCTLQSNVKTRCAKQKQKNCIQSVGVCGVCMCAWCRASMWCIIQNILLKSQQIHQMFRMLKSQKYICGIFNLHTIFCQQIIFRMHYYYNSNKFKELTLCCDIMSRSLSFAQSHLMRYKASDQHSDFFPPEYLMQWNNIRCIRSTFLSLSRMLMSFIFPHLFCFTFSWKLILKRLPCRKTGHVLCMLKWLLLQPELWYL